MSDGTTCCEDKAEMGDRELGGRQSQGREVGSVVGEEQGLWVAALDHKGVRGDVGTSDTLGWADVTRGRGIALFVPRTSRHMTMVRL